MPTKTKPRPRVPRTSVTREVVQPGIFGEIADFLATPANIDTILADVEAKKATYTFE